MKDWQCAVADRLRKKNKILFSYRDPFLFDLTQNIAAQPHKCIILWAFSFSEELVCLLKSKYPHEVRPRELLTKARQWAAGEIKMSEAKRAILACHTMAKEVNSLEDTALCHALGQACSTVHTAGHAMGLPVYELSALVRRYGLEGCAEAVEMRKSEYFSRLRRYSLYIEHEKLSWAPFIK